MIILRELNPRQFKTTPEQDANLNDLLKRLNVIREAYAHPMTVTSGLRDLEDHKRIYKAKGIPEDKIPMGSAHLKGCGADIGDANGKLKEWINNNINVLEEAGLWCEDFSATPTWCHFQSYPPKSGKRFFMP